MNSQTFSNIPTDIALGIILILFILSVTHLIKQLKAKTNPDSPLVHFAVYLRKATEESTGVPSAMRWMNVFAEFWWVPAVTIAYLVVVIAAVITRDPVIAGLVGPFTITLMSALVLMLGLKGWQAIWGEKPDTTPKDGGA